MSLGPTVTRGTYSIVLVPCNKNQPTFIHSVVHSFDPAQSNRYAFVPLFPQPLVEVEVAPPTYSAPPPFIRICSQCGGRINRTANPLPHTRCARCRLSWPSRSIP